MGEGYDDGNLDSGDLIAAAVIGFLVGLVFAMAVFAVVSA